MAKGCMLDHVMKGMTMRHTMRRSCLLMVEVAAFGIGIFALGTARAHCDTTGGPIIPEAKAVLEKGDDRLMRPCRGLRLRLTASSPSRFRVCVNQGQFCQSSQTNGFRSWLVHIHVEKWCYCVMATLAKTNMHLRDRGVTGRWHDGVC